MTCDYTNCYVEVVNPLNSALDESHRESLIASMIGSMCMIMSQLKRSLYLRSLGVKNDEDGIENVIWKYNFGVFVIISQLFQVITLAKHVPSILELNCNQRFWHEKARFVIKCSCRPCTQRRNRSSYVADRTTKGCDMYKNEKCTCKACKTAVIHCQICKFVMFLSM